MDWPHKILLLQREMDFKGNNCFVEGLVLCRHCNSHRNTLPLYLHYVAAPAMVSQFFLLFKGVGLDGFADEWLLAKSELG